MVFLSTRSILGFVLAVSAAVSVLGVSTIDLGAAEDYTILAGTTVTSTGNIGTVINGDMGVFPGSEVTGFPPAKLNGDLDAANGAAGLAQGALTTAYNNAAGTPATATLSNTDLGGLTLLPGVYKFDAAAALNGVLTLDCGLDPNAVWIFQIGSSLLVAQNSAVIFKSIFGSPKNVFWQVGSSATLSIGSSLQGNVLALKSIWLSYGAKVTGRLLARNAAVTLDYNTVSAPSS